MSDYPNERDCEHGHKRGKCVSCDLIESESRVRELEATLAARTESLEAALASRAAMESELARVKGALGEACFLVNRAKWSLNGTGLGDDMSAFLARQAAGTEVTK